MSISGSKKLQRIVIAIGTVAMCSVWQNGGGSDRYVRGLAFPAATYVGLVLQLVATSAVLVAIDSRLRRPMRVAAAG